MTVDLHLEEDTEMQVRTQELLDGLERANWFSALGQPMSGMLQDEIIVVSSWAEAVESCGSNSWENFTREQLNLLTMYLHDHARDRYRRWNEIVVEMKAAFEHLIGRKIKPVIEEHNLPKAVEPCVHWDVLGACMESEYADVRSPGFFTDLMGWYMRGRFPCGWGQVDPDGQIRLAEMEPEGVPDGPDPFTRSLYFPLLEPPIRFPEGKLIIF